MGPIDDLQHTDYTTPRRGKGRRVGTMDYSTARIMILGRWCSDAFLVYIRPQVLDQQHEQRHEMTPSSTPRMSLKPTQTTLAPAAASLSMVTYPLSLGYTCSTESEALRAPRRYSMVESITGSGVCLFAKLPSDTPKFSWFLAHIISSLLSAVRRLCSQTIH
jgi:hypothetical protein